MPYIAIQLVLQQCNFHLVPKQVARFLLPVLLYLNLRVSIHLQYACIAVAFTRCIILMFYGLENNNKVTRDAFTSILQMNSP